MLTKAFLSPTEIKERIAQEAASDKERKLTPEQIEAIYSNGTNILVSASAGSGKTFVMVSVSLIWLDVVLALTNSLSQPLR